MKQINDEGQMAIETKVVDSNEYFDDERVETEQNSLMNYRVGKYVRVVGFPEPVRII